MLIRNVALVLVCAISSGLAQDQQPAPTPSIVYAVRNPDSIKQYKTNPHVVREMVNRLVMAVTGESDVAKAWGSLVSPGERVGIKISAAGGELFTTHHDIVNAIVDGLAAAGHPRSSIIVWDRSLGGIKEAGYRPSVDGYQVKAIAPHDGYDAKAMLSAPLAGKLVWGDSRVCRRHREDAAFRRYRRYEQRESFFEDHLERRGQSYQRPCDERQ